MLVKCTVGTFQRKRSHTDPALLSSQDRNVTHLHVLDLNSNQGTKSSNYRSRRGYVIVSVDSVSGMMKCISRCKEPICVHKYLALLFCLLSCLDIPTGQIISNGWRSCLMAHFSQHNLDVAPGRPHFSSRRVREFGQILKNPLYIIPNFSPAQQERYNLKLYKYSQFNLYFSIWNVLICLNQVFSNVIGSAR